jgi:hypothetical protein
MSKRPLALATLTLTAGLMLAGTATAAYAHEGNHGTSPTTKPANQTAQANPTGPVDTAFFVAEANGANEVPVAGGPAVGDKDGKARTIVRIQGNQISFTSEYTKIAAPTAGHIHAGVAGTNGGIKVGFFGSALPGNLRAVTGTVTSDAATIAAIKANPEAHYVNLHTAEFPGGAVRGQLRKLDKPVDLLAPLRGPLVSLLDGGQELPNFGDLDGRATGFARARKDKIDYALTWSGIAPPTIGHIHNARVGVAGPVVAELFKLDAGLPASVQGVAGTVDAAKNTVKNLARRPHEFYFNVHNAEFPGGAVRGQLFRP